MKKSYSAVQRHNLRSYYHKLELLVISSRFRGQIDRWYLKTGEIAISVPA